MKKIVSLAVAAVLGVFSMFTLSAVVDDTPAYAESCTCSDGSKGVKTAILAGGCSCDNGNGEGINQTLNLVVRIMTVGIGVLGVIGIVVVGIQYLTAGDKEEQTRKAKRRLFEIILGLFAYVVLYAVLKWLIPGFGF